MSFALGLWHKRGSIVSDIFVSTGKKIVWEITIKQSDASFAFVDEEDREKQSRTNILEAWMNFV